MKRKLIWLFLLFLTSLTTLVFYILIKQNDPQLQASTTATSFMVALVRNDKQMLEEIVVPQQRDRISEWLALHEPFTCPFGFDLPLRIRNIPTHTRPISQDVNLYNKNYDYGTTISYDAFYQCRIDINSDKGLNFQMWDVVLEQQNGRWHVKSWGDFCESKRLNGCW